MHSEPTDLDEAIRCVLDYCSAMNDWETRRFHRSRLEIGYEFTAERDRRLAGPRSAAELDAEYVTIFRQHCTDRKRQWSGHSSSYGQPPQFSNASQEAVLEATHPKPGRIEIAIRCGNMADVDHKFVVLKRKSRWLIDSVQWRIKNGAWERGVL